MKKFRTKFLHIGTVMGYMWTGWLCAVGETWYWIIAILLMTAVVHVAGIYFEIEQARTNP